jgi:hypothetical protein
MAKRWNSSGSLSEESGVLREAIRSSVNFVGYRLAVMDAVP